MKLTPTHRRRINTEEKAKDVAAAWGTELIKFVTILAILHFGEFEEQDEFILFFKSSWCNSSYSSKHPSAKQLAWQEIESILSSKQQRRPLPFLRYLFFSCGQEKVSCTVHTNSGRYTLHKEHSSFLIQNYYVTFAFSSVSILLLCSSYLRSSSGSWPGLGFCCGQAQQAQQAHQHQQSAASCLNTCNILPQLTRQGICFENRRLFYFKGGYVVFHLSKCLKVQEDHLKKVKKLS